MVDSIEVIDWQETPSGFAGDGYEVVREDAHRWRLEVRGRQRHGRYHTASAARGAAERIERARRRRLGLRRLAFGLAIVMGSLVAVIALRTEDNPARAEAEVLVFRMEAARAQIVAGTADVEAYQGSGEIEHAAIVTLPHGEEITALMGSAGGECYVLYWRSDEVPKARVLADVLPCEPGPVIVSSNESSYKRITPVAAQHLGGVTSGFDWNGVLPDATRQRTWFLPALLVLIAVGVWMLVRASMTALTGGEPRR